MKPAIAIRMWAVVIVGSRTEWINYETIRRTRREAANAYLGFWDESYRAEETRKRNKRWRTVPVTVTPHEEDTFR